MKQIRDVEDCLIYSKESVVDNFNKCIIWMNNQKNDSIVLEQIPLATDEEINTHIYFDMDEVPESNIFILITLFPTIESVSVKGLVAKKVTLSSEIFFTINNYGNNSPEYIKGLRYMTVLEKVYIKEARDLGIEMKSLTPLVSTRKDIQRVQAGVELTFNYA